MFVILSLTALHYLDLIYLQIAKTDNCHHCPIFINLILSLKDLSTIKIKKSKQLNYNLKLIKDDRC